MKISDEHDAAVALQATLRRPRPRTTGVAYQALIETYDAAGNLLVTERIERFYQYRFEAGCFICSYSDFEQMRRLREGEVVTVTEIET